ncbi:MAG: lysozyme inhibitor LprI family protein [Lachnotalea sp.]
MKKNMIIIFVVAVIFIISVGVLGMIRGNYFTGNSYSSSKLRADNDGTVQEDSGQEAEVQTSEQAQESKSVTTGQITEDNENTETQDIQNAEITQAEQGSHKQKTDKEQYLTRLDSIKNYYEDLWNQSGSFDMAGMKELRNQEYTKWDDELNTIYQQIKKKFSEEDFITVRDEERQWITDRDEKSALAASNYTGGTMESLEYMSSMTNITRERTYELVEIYFEE